MSPFVILELHPSLFSCFNFSYAVVLIRKGMDFEIRGSFDPL